MVDSLNVPSFFFLLFIVFFFHFRFSLIYTFSHCFTLLGPDRDEEDGQQVPRSEGGEECLGYEEVLGYRREQRS